MSNDSIRFPEDIEKLSDEQVVNMVMTFLSDSESAQEEWRKRALIADNFYKGDQWDSKSEENLKLRHIQPVTINLIKANIQFLAGTQKRNKTDIIYKPIKAGTHTVAKILTSLAKHTMDKSYGEYEESEAFSDGIRGGKGWLKISVDKTYDSINGDFVYEKVDPLNVYEDMTAREYDLNKSAKYIVEIIYEDKEKLMLEFPKSLDKLKNLSFKGTGIRDNTMKRHLYGDDAFTTDSTGNINRDVYRFPVMVCWFKSHEKRWHWTDRQTLADKIVTSKEEIDVAKKQTKDNPKKWSLTQTVDKILWRAKVVNNILLELVKDPFKPDDDEGEERDLQPSVNLFPLVRYVSGFVNGHIQGEIDNLISPQEEKNKNRTINLANNSATSGSGFDVEEGSISKEMEEILQDEGAAPGLMIKYRAGKNPPKRRQPNQISSASVYFEQQAEKDFESVSGINKANQGVERSSQSGKANQLQQIQGLTINTTVFDNLSYTKRILGTLLHDLIRSTNVYSNQEIEAILDDIDLIDIKTMQQASNNVAKNNPPPNINQMINSTDPSLVRQSLEAFKVLQEDFEDKVREEAKKLIFAEIKDINKGRYGVKVTESDITETVRMKRINEVLTIEQLRPGVLPFDTLINATDIDDKEEIIQAIKAQQQAQQQFIQQQQALAQGEAPTPDQRADRNNPAAT